MGVDRRKPLPLGGCRRGGLPDMKDYAPKKSKKDTKK